MFFISYVIYQILKCQGVDTFIEKITCIIYTVYNLRSLAKHWQFSAVFSSRKDSEKCQAGKLITWHYPPENFPVSIHAIMQSFFCCISYSQRRISRIISDYIIVLNQFLRPTDKTDSEKWNKLYRRE